MLKPTIFSGDDLSILEKWQRREELNILEQARVDDIIMNHPTEAEYFRPKANNPGNAPLPHHTDLGWDDDRFENGPMDKPFFPTDPERKDPNDE